MISCQNIEIVSERDSVQKMVLDVSWGAIESQLLVTYQVGLYGLLFTFGIRAVDTVMRQVVSLLGREPDPPAHPTDPIKKIARAFSRCAIVMVLLLGRKPKDSPALLRVLFGAMVIPMFVALEFASLTAITGVAYAQYFAFGAFPDIESSYQLMLAVLLLFTFSLLARANELFDNPGQLN